MRGFAEHIPMHQLPPSLVRCVFCRDDLVVSRDVSVQSLDQDQSNHAGQDRHDHRGIDDRYPMHSLISLQAEIHIPTAGPANVTGDPLHVIRVDDGPLDVQGEGLHGDVTEEGRPILALGLELGHGERLHLEIHNAAANELRGLLMVVQADDHMVIQHVLLRLRPILQDRAQSLSPHREPQAIYQRLPCPDGREIVYDPIHHVIVIDDAAQVVSLVCSKLVAAELLARLVAHHLDLVPGWFDGITGQHGTQVLTTRLSLGWLRASRQVIVVVGDLRPAAGQLVRRERHGLPVQVGVLGYPREDVGPGGYGK
mmetsp:Transcript_67746/g.180391  ORF Transcript_67746/g.180391 Transcript_67746/m.180391 type:complete len:311 (-) Transcript_67746:40-972(-)